MEPLGKNPSLENKGTSPTESTTSTTSLPTSRFRNALLASAALLVAGCTPKKPLEPVTQPVEFEALEEIDAPDLVPAVVMDFAVQPEHYQSGQFPRATNVGETKQHALDSLINKNRSLTPVVPAVKLAVEGEQIPTISIIPFNGEQIQRTLADGTLAIGHARRASFSSESRSKRPPMEVYFLGDEGNYERFALQPVRDSVDGFAELPNHEIIDIVPLNERGQMAVVTGHPYVPHPNRHSENDAVSIEKETDFFYNPYGLDEGRIFILDRPTKQVRQIRPVNDAGQPLRITGMVNLPSGKWIISTRDGGIWSSQDNGVRWAEEMESFQLYDLQSIPESANLGEILYSHIYQNPINGNLELEVVYEDKYVAGQESYGSQNEPKEAVYRWDPPSDQNHGKWRFVDFRPFAAMHDEAHSPMRWSVNGETLGENHFHIDYDSDRGVEHVVRGYRDQDYLIVEAVPLEHGIKAPSSTHLALTGPQETTHRYVNWSSSSDGIWFAVATWSHPGPLKERKIPQQATPSSGVVHRLPPIPGEPEFPGERHFFVNVINAQGQIESREIVGPDAFGTTYGVGITGDDLTVCGELAGADRYNRYFVCSYMPLNELGPQAIQTLEMTQATDNVFDKATEIEWDNE